LQRDRGRDSPAVPITGPAQGAVLRGGGHHGARNESTSANTRGGSAGQWGQGWTLTPTRTGAAASGKPRAVRSWRSCTANSLTCRGAMTVTSYSAYGRSSVDA